MIMIKKGRRPDEMADEYVKAVTGSLPFPAFHPIGVSPFKRTPRQLRRPCQVFGQIHFRIHTFKF